MRNSLLFSFSVHLLLLLLIMIIPTPKQKKSPPMKVYMVKILSKPESPKERVVARKKIKKKVVPKKKPKVKPKKKEIAKKKEMSRQPKIPTSVKLDNPTFDSPFYINLILTKVTNNWLDPLPTTKAHLVATVYFRIVRSGKLKDLKIENSSGSPIFDQGAIKAISLSEPFPPLPDEYKSDFLGVHFEFEHVW